MKSSSARPIVDSVLSYIPGFIQLAQLRNDLHSVWHWQECWRLVFEQFFGAFILPRAKARPIAPYTVVSTPLVRPRWFVEKYSRPACKVIGQMTKRVRSGASRECFSIDYDLLECGHKIMARFSEPGTPPARWRYCKECPPKNQQMREAGMTGSNRSNLPSGTKTAFAVTGAVNTISRSRRVSRRAA